VALHLLSEKEKKEMAQLVKTMVSYAITYKNKKVDPLPNKMKYEVTTDAPVLSFDPPIGDFVNFEGYNCNYFLLALAVKQVLCHEVEKQKILQSSLNKAKNGNDVYDEKRAYLAGKDNMSKPKCLPENTKSISNLKNPSGQKQSDTKAPVNTSAPASGKSAVSYEVTKPTETKKKRVSGSFNFFERFKRVSVNGSQITEPVEKVPATSERDSRPVLFKYNELFQLLSNQAFASFIVAFAAVSMGVALLELGLAQAADLPKVISVSLCGDGAVYVVGLAKHTKKLLDKLCLP
ncbi:hypothetical protein Tco_0864623, partial [Tanacetum coccineum]